MTNHNLILAKFSHTEISITLHFQPENIVLRNVLPKSRHKREVWILFDLFNCIYSELLDRQKSLPCGVSEFSRDIKISQLKYSSTSDEKKAR